MRKIEVTVRLTAKVPENEAPLAGAIAEALERLATSKSFMDGSFPSGRQWTMHMEKPQPPVEITVSYGWDG